MNRINVDIIFKNIIVRILICAGICKTSAASCNKVIAMLLLLHNIIAVETNKIVTLWQLAFNG